VIGDFSNFAKNLDLSLYASKYRDLLHISREVFVRSEEERLRLTSGKEYDDPSFPAYLEPLRGMFAEAAKEYAEEKGKGERSKVIYYDFERRIIWNTETTHGEYATTTVPTYDLFSTLIPGNGEGRKLPLLEVHTHPENGLFSPKDLLRMVHGSGQVRGIRGSVVLCPDIQLLALATAQTPVYPQSHISQFLEEWESKIAEQDEHEGTKVFEQRRITREHYDEYMNEIFKEIEGTCWAYKELLDKGEITVDQYARFFKREFHKSKNYRERHERVERMEAASKRKRDAFVNRMHDSAHIKMLRELNIKLYSAHDLAYFTEFSA
jgi:hypothetical protein